MNKNYRARLLTISFEKTRPDMATLVFRLSSGQIVFWQVRDTKWKEAPKKKTAREVDYRKEFGTPRAEFKDMLVKKFKGTAKDVGIFFFSSLQTHKDSNGNTNVKITDGEGSDFLAKYVKAPEFLFFLKY